MERFCSWWYATEKAFIANRMKGECSAPKMPTKIQLEPNSLLQVTKVYFKNINLCSGVFLYGSGLFGEPCFYTSSFSAVYPSCYWRTVCYCQSSIARKGIKQDPRPLKVTMMNWWIKISFKIQWIIVEQSLIFFKFSHVLIWVWCLFLLHAQVIFITTSTQEVSNVN